MAVWFPAIAWLGGVSITTVSVAAAELPGVAGFVKSHCLDCHSGETKEGGLDLQTLDGNLADRGLFAKMGPHLRPRGLGRDAAQVGGETSYCGASGVFR